MNRLAIDIGSAFVDLVLIRDGAPLLHKAPLQGDAAQALALGLAALGCDPAGLDEIRLASTAPLNALLSRSPAQVGLLTTAGFADTLWLARQNRLDLYDPVARSGAPTFLVAPGACHEVAGRVAVDGCEVTPLDEAAVRAAALGMRDAGIRAIAICFLFAHVAPAQEQRAAEVIAEVWPDVPVSLSHVVDPAPREYERTVSTVLDAWLRATALPVLEDLADRLSQAGFAGRWLFGDGRGGVVSRRAALAHPAAILGAGPAAAASAAAGLAPEGTALGLDIGSVSTDLSLSRQGTAEILDAAVWAGVPLRQTMADIESVAMGGSCAVTLASDGVRFGPAAPNVASLQDALGVLGRIEGPDGAKDRVSDIAAPAGVTPAGFAVSVVETAEHDLAARLMRYATRRNVDPVRSDLVAMGGLGPILAAGIAQVLNMPRIRIPCAPAVAGALGLAGLSSRFEATARPETALQALTQDDMTALIEDLSDALVQQIAASDGTMAGPTRLVAWLAARPQMHPMRIALDRPPRDGAELAKAFADGYAAQFGIGPPGPGHLFRLALICDGAPCAVPAMDLPKGRVAGGPTGTAVNTPAGTIWVAPGWCLSPAHSGWVMQREEDAT